MHPDVVILFNHHRRPQVALGHPDGDGISLILGFVERFLRQVQVATASPAEEQVVGEFSGFDDNPLENNIIDHGNLH